MYILAIESSAKFASVALCRDDFLIAECYQNSGLTHSTTLMPMCESMLKNCGITLDQVDVIAAANGPGSFTGLRIGLAAAKGLAWPAEKPCIGVSTLEAMAWNLCGVEGTLCCAMDARRQQVYTASFRMTESGPQRLTEDRAISLPQLFSELDQEQYAVTFVGDGAQLCHDYAAAQGKAYRLAPPNLRFQHAYGVARAAWEKLQQEGASAGSGQELTANYLRLSQAERERLAKQTT